MSKRSSAETDGSAGYSVSVGLINVISTYTSAVITTLFLSDVSVMHESKAK